MSPETILPEHELSLEELQALDPDALTKEADLRAEAGNKKALATTLAAAKARLLANVQTEEYHTWKPVWEHISALFLKANGHGIDNHHDQPGPGASGIA